MTTRQPNLPELTGTSPRELIAWARQIKLALGVLSEDIPTTDEAALDGAVTFRDLIEAGIAIEAPKGSKSLVLPGDGSSSSFAAPPAPTGFVVVRLPYNMRLSWTAPTYPGHSYTEVWRSTTLNSLTSASKIAEVPAGVSAYEDGFISTNFYWIRFVSAANVVGGFNAVSGTTDNSQPGDVTGLSFVFEGFGVRLRWNPVVDADLSHYEMRVGSTWDSGAPLDGGAPGAGTEFKGTSYLWRIQTAGSYTVWVRARDVSGFYSGTATSITIAIDAPAPISFAVGSPIVGDQLLLSWQTVGGTFSIDWYEVRIGNDWNTAVILDRALATIYLQKVNWGGSRRFWVAARDVAGNYGTPVSTDVVITSPGQVASIRAEVVDNNVLIFWTAPSVGTLPVQTYEIYKGATFAGSTLIGDKNGLFTSFFEQAPGTYTYWVRARDSAGNLGTERSVSTFVNQPPDFVLFSDQNPALSGATRSSADFDGSGIVLPFNTTETWDSHYSSRGWNTDNDAIGAGFPIYAQPAPTTGYFEVSIDYGGSIPATGVQVNPTLTTIAGTPTNVILISHKLLIGDAWTDMPTGPSAFITTPFRYIKVRLTATTSGSGVGVYRCTNLNIKLNVKQKSFAGQGTANSGDSGGTLFYLTTDGNAPGGGNALLFVDCFGPPLVQPAGTTPIMAVVDFTDVPNPQSFRVLLFNDAGVRQTAAISWTARGV